ncbi:histidinol-phosphate transaminase [Streptomyces sp. YGL11-2]|uniref:histidinol-phosphate transaminase n=1 Tax=Streptomyces sp. YGL11-2 TaxID=3414028 RepID=UPI003CEB5D41
MGVNFRAALGDVSPYQAGSNGEGEARRGRVEKVLLAQNEDAYGPVPAAQRAIQEEAARGHRYPEAGFAVLKRQIAAHHRISEDNIFPAAGSCAVFHYLSLCLLDPGDEVVFCSPTFSAYRLEALKMGAVPVSVPLDAEGAYDPAGLLAAITDRTKIVYVANPNNPTGGLVTRASLSAFLDAVPGHVLTVIDEAYFDYVDDPAYPDSIVEFFSEERPVVVTRTFSKIFGLAGLRVGYGVLPADIARKLSKVQMPFEINRFAVAAATATLQADPAEIRRRREATAEGRLRLVGELTAAGYPPLPASANFLQVPVGDAAAVAHDLAELGVLVRPLGSWGQPDAIRVTVGTAEETTRFLDAFRSVMATGRTS